MKRAEWLQAVWYGERQPGVGLMGLSLLFRGLAFARRRLWRAGLLRQTRLPVPVVVVGNISVGGTGKTPMVQALWQRLTAAGLRVGVVSRGVGGVQQLRQVEPSDAPDEVGDEPLLLARRGVRPLWVGRDRPAAARALLARQPVDLIVSDDGLQHYALARQFEIIMMDGERGLGNGRLLPAGPLREPETRLATADAVVCTGKAVAGLDCRVMCLDPGALMPVASGGKRVPELCGQRVHAVAGIGHPRRFFSMLEDMGMDVIAHPFADHHPFRAEDLDFGDELPVVMTEKDAVKCRAFARPHWYYLPVEARFDPAFEAWLLARLRQLQTDPVKEVFCG